MYLHVTSSYPSSVKNEISYGLWVRPKRIRSNENDYQIRRNEIKNHLRKRGYSNDIVENHLYKVDNLERENLLQYNTRKQNNRVPLVITYSKALPNIHDILGKNMIILSQSDKMKKVFNQPPIVSFRRDKTLKIYWCTVSTICSFIINVTDVSGAERTVHYVNTCWNPQHSRTTADIRL